MEIFKRKNEYGVDCNYYVVAQTEEEGKIYVIFTDFVPGFNGELRLFAGIKENDEINAVEPEREKRLVQEFKMEMEKLRKRGSSTLHYEDLSFTTVDENGEETFNDITCVLPNPTNKDEPYVIFTDYTFDENEEFVSRYGRLIQEDGNYSIETNLDKEEIDYIHEHKNDEIVQYVNDKIGENSDE